MLLEVVGVKKSFAGEVVAKDFSFSVDRGQKVALVGRNGCGKTTLLKIVVGRLEPDAGTVRVSPSAKIGYLKQEAPVGPGRSVRQEAEEGLQLQFQLLDRLEELRNKSGANEDLDDFDELAALEERFSESAYRTEADVKATLIKLGFDEPDFDKPTSSLSGGQRTRLALARILLESPDLLILDEPTNHLDLEATAFLESWLKSFRGALLIVSHDRAFLDAVSTKVVDVRDGTTQSYNAGFSQFVELKKAADARLADVAKKQDAEIAKLDEFVRRFMNSQRTAQARGRLKLKNRLEESRVQVVREEKSMQAAFKVRSRSGDIVARCEKLTVGYGDKPLLAGFDWTVSYREKWGVIGGNGSGKSTLMKTITGLIPALAGRSQLGSNVDLGYFSQDASDFDPEDSPIEVLVDEFNLPAEEARRILGRFLLTGDDVFRPLKTLSGGEKNKVSLARLMVSRPNLLILDEPTNHLDIPSQEALANVLAEYDGTLILVSHDRWLLNQTTDHILHIGGESTGVYPGSFAEYWSQRSGAGFTGVTSNPGVKGKGKLNAVPPQPTYTPRELSKLIVKSEAEVARIEGAIAENEDELKAIELRLSSPVDPGQAKDDSVRHQQVSGRLESLMTEWEQAHLQVEDLKKMQRGTAESGSL